MLPQDRSQNYGHRARGLTPMPLPGNSQLDIVTVLGGEEIRADEQQQDIGCVQINVDFSRPFNARQDTPIMPSTNEA
jgi:hypothetical protein